MNKIICWSTWLDQKTMSFLVLDQIARLGRLVKSVYIDGPRYHIAAEHLGEGAFDTSARTGTVSTENLLSLVVILGIAKRHSNRLFLSTKDGVGLGVPEAISAILNEVTTGLPEDIGTLIQNSCGIPKVIHRKCG
ncbi:hypothetical protein [Azonexus hydrophilus]|uniref:Uncharacterized protein n=1 Tax=Azonexus hydrophilus TaxID=418702 RepID=A0ABZ2XN05_9RHOO